MQDDGLFIFSSVAVGIAITIFISMCFYAFYLGGINTEAARVAAHCTHYKKVIIGNKTFNCYE
jgi:hypothetical protein